MQRFGTVLSVILAGVMLATVAVGAIGAPTRASEDIDGVGGDGSSTHARLSDDGTLVAFLSSADNLVGDDTNGVQDAFVKNLVTGEIARVSVASDGTEGNDATGSFGYIDISGDGQFVTFSSKATNLVAGDTNGFEDIFVHDLATGATELVSVDLAGNQHTSNSSHPALSEDGTFVAYLATTNSLIAVYDRDSDQTEYLDRDGANDFEGNWVDISADGTYVAFETRDLSPNSAYVRYDRDSDSWERADPRLSGDSESRLSWVSISGDGRYVAYANVDDNIVAGDSDDLVDVFVWDGNTGTVEIVEADAFTGGESLEVRPRLSADGQFLVFVTGITNDPYPGGTASYYEVYRYDRQADIVERISEYADGTPIDKHAKNPVVSADGRYVGFDTSSALDDDDVEGVTDVYVIDTVGTTVPPSGCVENFTDVDDNNVFQADICWLAQEGITLGCNPPVNDKFCPTGNVTRGQMAAFLVRALGYTDDGGGNLFVDDDDSVFESNIDRLGTAGVTLGCNPPTNDKFCPLDNVTRQQMAAFLRRALE